MFEVGKTYKTGEFPEIWECMSIVEDGKFGWMKTDLSKSNRIYTPYQTYQFGSSWTEVKEPVIEKVIAQIVDMGTRVSNTGIGPALGSVPDSFLTLSKVVGRVEYTLKDGVLIDAKVLPNV